MAAATGPSTEIRATFFITRKFILQNIEPEVRCFLTDEILSTKVLQNILSEDGKALTAAISQKLPSDAWREYLTFKIEEDETATSNNTLTCTFNLTTIDLSLNPKDLTEILTQHIPTIIADRIKKTEAFHRWQIIQQANQLKVAIEKLRTELASLTTEKNTKQADIVRCEEHPNIEAAQQEIRQALKNILETIDPDLKIKYQDIFKYLHQRFTDQLTAIWQDTLQREIERFAQSLERLEIDLTNTKTQLLELISDKPIDTLPQTLDELKQQVLDFQHRIDEQKKQLDEIPDAREQKLIETVTLPIRVKINSLIKSIRAETEALEKTRLTQERITAIRKRIEDKRDILLTQLAAEEKRLEEAGIKVKIITQARDTITSETTNCINELNKIEEKSKSGQLKFDLAKTKIDKLLKKFDGTLVPKWQKSCSDIHEDTGRRVRRKQKQEADATTAATGKETKGKKKVIPRPPPKIFFFAGTPSGSAVRPPAEMEGAAAAGGKTPEQTFQEQGGQLRLFIEEGTLTPLIKNFGIFYNLIIRFNTLAQYEQAPPSLQNLARTLRDNLMHHSEEWFREKNLLETVANIMLNPSLDWNLGGNSIEDIMHNTETVFLPKIEDTLKKHLLSHLYTPRKLQTDYDFEYYLIKFESALTAISNFGFEAKEGLEGNYIDIAGNVERFVATLGAIIKIGETLQQMRLVAQGNFHHSSRIQKKEAKTFLQQFGLSEEGALLVANQRNNDLACFLAFCHNARGDVAHTTDFLPERLMNLPLIEEYVRPPLHRSSSKFENIFRATISILEINYPERVTTERAADTTQIEISSTHF